MMKNLCVRPLLRAFSFIAVAAMSTHVIAADTDTQTPKPPSRTAQYVELSGKLWNTHLEESRKITTLWLTSTEAADNKLNSELNKCVILFKQNEQLAENVRILGPSDSQKWEESISLWERAKSEANQKWHRAWDDYNHTIEMDRLTYGQAGVRESQRFHAHLADLPRYLNMINTSE